MLQSVDHEFGNDQAQTDRLVRGDIALVRRHLDGQNIRVGNHRGGEAFAELNKVGPDRNVIEARHRKVALDRGGRHGAMVGVLKVATHFFWLHLSSALHQHARDDPKAVAPTSLQIPIRMVEAFFAK